MAGPSVVRIQAPATVGNFGPGFDAFALALHGLGDRIELRPSEEDAVALEGPGIERIPPAWEKNVACAALDAVRKAAGHEGRFELRITKGQPPGSGLGSSASSAGGAVLAFHASQRRGRLPPEELVRAAGEGEAVAAGRHYDDVAAVIQGGLAIVRVRDGEIALSRVMPPRGLHIAVVLPGLELKTRDMRRILPKRVARDDAVHNLANAAALVEAFHHDDIEAIGQSMDDRIATPARKAKMAYFEDARAAALAHGAFGAALSGSGPAMVAVCDSRRAATRAADAMAGAVEAHRLKARAFAAVPEREVMHRAVALH